MIRNSNSNTAQTQNFRQLQIINYRNAIIQAQFYRQSQQKFSNGIIYIPNTHHFIAFSQFQSNYLSGYCLFFHDHSKYMYGHWKQNKLHGFVVLRIYQILIITEYNNGILVKGTHILILFERYNKILLMEAGDAQNWQIIQKFKVNTDNKLQDVISKSKFSQNQQICHSLIKFLKRKMILDPKGMIKLRLINNKYYRYGFDNGIAIIFDDQFQIISNGLHNRTMICDVGIKFNKQQLSSIVEQGIFDGKNTFVYSSLNRPVQKITKIYKKYHLSSINFKNNFFVNPCEPYFKYFQKMLQSSFIKQTFSNTIINKSSEYDSYQKIINQQKNQDKCKHNYKGQDQISFFNKNSDKIAPNIDGLRQSVNSLNQYNQIDIIKMSMGEYIQGLPKDNRQFQKLSQKMRLEILKKELQQNLNQKRKITNQSIQMHKNDIDQVPKQKSKIITMQRVNFKNIIKDKQKQNLIIHQQIQKDNNQRQLITLQNLYANNDLALKQNLSRSQQTENRSKSKQRLKIFDLDKSIKRDYSAQNQLSPFKSRMRARIFNKTPQKSQKTPENKNKIFSNRQSTFKQNKVQQYQLEDGNFQKNSKYFSPYNQLISSRQKKQQKQKIEKASILNKKQQIRQNQLITNLESSLDKNKKLKQPDIPLGTLKKNQTIRQENILKRDNRIYKNSLIKEQYGNYIYEPINVLPVKESGNSPYISNSKGQNLIKVKSFSQLKNQQQAAKYNKKSIASTSPLKMKKIKNYLNNQSSKIQKNNTLQKLASNNKKFNYF